VCWGYSHGVRRSCVQELNAGAWQWEWLAVALCAPGALSCHRRAVRTSAPRLMLQIWRRTGCGTVGTPLRTPGSPRVLAASAPEPQHAHRHPPWTLPAGCQAVWQTRMVCTWRLVRAQMHALKVVQAPGAPEHPATHGSCPGCSGCTECCSRSLSFGRPPAAHGVR
jgi:hypothetical protein